MDGAAEGIALGKRCLRRTKKIPTDVQSFKVPAPFSFPTRTTAQDRVDPRPSNLTSPYSNARPYDSVTGSSGFAPHSTDSDLAIHEAEQRLTEIEMTIEKLRKRTS